MQRLLDYLNRIVFKLIVSSERIQYFVTGYICGRDSMLIKRFVNVDDIVETKDPFASEKI